MCLLDEFLHVGKYGMNVFFRETDAGIAREVLDGLLDGWRIVGNIFGDSNGSMSVNAVLASNRKEFDLLVKDHLGVDIEQPSNPERIAQAQRECMVLLSPSAYECESVFRYAPDDFKRLLSHELLHILEERFSPDIESSRRWWSEGLAVYFSGQWEIEPDFNSVAIMGISEDTIPGLDEIESSPRLAYDWGWTVVWFIDSFIGRDKIVQIVKECSDGNVFAFLGDVDTLEANWKSWLKEHVWQIRRK